MLYYESHITIEPVFDDKLELASNIAIKYKFKVASLLMQKRKEDSPERSKNDTFMTSHDSSYEAIKDRMTYLIVELQANGFIVWRYKIEDVKLDSRIDDSLNLLNNN